MADPVVADPREEPGPEFEPLAIPPLDEQFLSSDDAMGLGDFLADPELGFDLGLELDDNWGCEFTFDDIGDLTIPCEADGFLIPEVFENDSQSPIGADPVPKSASPESESSAVSVIGGYDVAGFLNSPAESNNPGGNSNSLSPDSGNCDHEYSGGPASSIGSGNCGSGVSEGESSLAVEKKVKPEAIGSKKENSVPKRKKEADEEGNSESRTPKFRRSEISPESPAPDDDDEKKKARLMRNRESAQLSRQRKKHYVEELEDKVRIMNSTIADLNNRISYIMAENAGLRQQMSGVGSGGGVAGPAQTPPGMYPHPVMPYPWVPCPPYMMKPQGHVPLVPIPRLKPQHTAKASKKSEGRKSGESGRTKKVASISFLGLLFFVLLFGGLVPMMNVNFGGFNDNSPSGFGFASGRLYDQHRERVLTVDDGLSRSGESVGVRHNGKEKGSHQNSQCSGESGGGGIGSNISEPLVASLYVPRNDKMVKIDGNLIIHSVLASEKTKASLANLELKRNTETRLAIARNIPPSYAVPEAGANPARRVPSYSAERQKALSSGASEAANSRLKSSPADGRLQQWFREGLAGDYSILSRFSLI